ncbi:MAG: hypothetical protein CO186_02275 [Zetaproteobacteria bacterium CG_4_9_14_3_um_filter_49_83]|nr:MAG: hypothetical protein AUJ56_06320 [Zetaproteobacteria bacterium CG1_02_49_23]PIQ33435.1 MAG: hypothetical protein COW62_05040 [Zetaproteobacteria bacterium CG17_big_fil_post_rev_8_21_14_2_50_50_13]PIV29104.1 MAG: hypothetical protein COS35_13765 [Zetaproteobacteria bacterium CG02_land_8_20_14_3_00_50_9]PIY55642.1 MAG: hypothetical protein COZ00_08105 [Zetaproteobacteria bacterium CG_4_10_14_0_8_um_filter_49_80]PJA35992.1 MAG: hypothetical protein CO186_02275 [Zetaproteobacteria bacterium
MLKHMNWMTVINTVIILLAMTFIAAIVQSIINPAPVDTSEKGLPFYSTANAALERSGAELYKSLQCRSCHTIWGVKSIYETVPAPSLDGIGSWRSEEWLFAYFSAVNPQEMLPTRLKEKYKMPSYSNLSVTERDILAKYFSSLKVRAWYLEEARKAEEKKLKGS